MTKKTNLKTLMAGTTTLLMGLNVFVSPVQAAEQGESGQQGSQIVDESASSDSQNETDVKGKVGVAPQSEKIGDESTTDPTDKQNDDARLNAGIYKDESEAHYKDENGVEHKTTLSQVAKHLDETDPLGIASMFHIFADKVTQNGDLNGNIAANEFSSNKDFGTRKGQIGVDHTNIDIMYIKKIGQLSSGAFRDETGSKVVIGENLIKHDDEYNGGQYHVKIGDNDYNFDAIRPKNHEKNKANHASDLQQDANYIDIKGELEKLTQKSQDWMHFDTSSSVATTDKSDSAKKNLTYDVSKAEVDDSGSNIYIQLPVEYLGNTNNEITIQGLNKDSKKNIIINVVTPDKDKNTKLNINAHVFLKYGKDHSLSNGESHTDNNPIFWNFGTVMGEVHLGPAYMGTMLAPQATITNDSNIDGNLIAKNVTVTGETHRWDYNPEHFYVEIPIDDKDKQPGKEQPGKEQPGKEQPGKEQPGKEQPGKEQPGKEQPGKEQPGKEQPGKEQPGKEQPGKEQPGKEQPGKEQPGKEQPGKEQPGKEQPGKEQPGKEQPGKEQPGKEQPGKEQPGKEQPGKEQPGKEQPGKEQPGKEQPGKEQPGKEQPGKEQPGKEQPGKEQPGKEQPGKEQPGKEQPGKEQPGKEQPGKEQPGKEQPGKEQPGKEQPGKEQPGKEQPGKEQPGKEQPGKEQPGNNTPEQPNFLKPQPKTPDQPQTPNFSEPKSKTPFPDSETVTPSKPKNDAKSFFKAQAKKHVVTKNVAKKTAVDKKKPVTQAPKIDVEHNKVTTAKTVTTAVPKKTSVETVSVKKATPKATLPQTGEKQNHTALIGLALSAAALIVGLFGKTKKD